jgi:Ca2+/Na+ antiporter
MLKNFNYMFFVTLVCLSLALLYGGWSYKSAKNIILDNQKYKHIDQKQERQFNEWDLERMYKFHFAFGVFFFVLTVAYLLMSINLMEVIKNANKKTPKKKNGK